MKPTEYEMTVAVDAVARHVYEQTARPPASVILSGGAPLSFDELGPLVKNQYRESVLSVVVVALEAIPDRAAAAEHRTLVRAAKYLTDQAMARFAEHGPQDPRGAAFWDASRALDPDDGNALAEGP